MSSFHDRPQIPGVAQLCCLDVEHHSAQSPVEVSRANATSWLGSPDIVTEEDERSEHMLWHIPSGAEWTAAPRLPSPLAYTTSSGSSIEWLALPQHGVSYSVLDRPVYAAVTPCHDELLHDAWGSRAIHPISCNQTALRSCSSLVFKGRDLSGTPCTDVLFPSAAIGPGHDGVKVIELAHTAGWTPTMRIVELMAVALLHRVDASFAVDLWEPGSTVRVRRLMKIATGERAFITTLLIDATGASGDLATDAGLSVAYLHAADNLLTGIAAGAWMWVDLSGNKLAGAVTIPSVECTRERNRFDHGFQLATTRLSTEYFLGSRQLV